MNDNSPEMSAHYRSMMMKKSPEERLMMGCSMFDTAKEIMISSIQCQHPKLTPQQLKAEIFLRLYKNDFNDSDRKKILIAFKTLE